MELGLGKGCCTELLKALLKALEQRKVVGWQIGGAENGREDNGEGLLSMFAYFG